MILFEQQFNVVRKLGIPAEINYRFLAHDENCYDNEKNILIYIIILLTL
jgi:hypothetical protein